MQTLHPSAALVYLGVLFLLTLFFTHPLYLLAIFLALGLVAWAAEALDAWETCLKVGLGMVVLIMLINPLAVRAGTSIIWSGPEVPVLGRLTISLESICYGAAMGLRLLNVISVFCLYNCLVHPDRALGIFSRFAPKSALIISLATRMLPTLARELSEIKEAQQTRGVDFGSGSWRERLKRYSTIFNVLLFTSMEGSLQVAEAMHARALGSGPRTCYQREPFRPRDAICLFAGGGALAAALCAKYTGAGDYHYYPQLGQLFSGFTDLIFLAAVLAGVLAPVVLSWGWQKCSSLRSKI